MYSFTYVGPSGVVTASAGVASRTNPYNNNYIGLAVNGVLKYQTTNPSLPAPAISGNLTVSNGDILSAMGHNLVLTGSSTSSFSVYSGSINTTFGVI